MGADARSRSHTDPLSTTHLAKHAGQVRAHAREGGFAGMRGHGGIRAHCCCCFRRADHGSVLVVVVVMTHCVCVKGKHRARARCGR